MAGGADVIMLDEPTAGMSHSETDYIVELIRRSPTANAGGGRARHGRGFRPGRPISVLVYGEIIATGAPDAVRANPAVQEAYLGTALEADH